MNRDYQRRNSSAARQGGEQYFAATPTTEDIRQSFDISPRGHHFSVETSRSVFSGSRLDLGTSVLLSKAPELPEEGNFLDIGCGWGPIALTMAAESPQAQVYAVDVNERAVALTSSNAKRNGIHNVQAMLTSQLDENLRFDVMWSNPPIRVGKQELHSLLMTYLPRLNVDGVAYLVVQKNLGADSLIPWLQNALDEWCASQRVNTSQTQMSDVIPAFPVHFSVSKAASQKGYRIIEVLRDDE